MGCLSDKSLEDFAGAGDTQDVFGQTHQTGLATIGEGNEQSAIDVDLDTHAVAHAGVDHTHTK